ncbi:MAG: metal-binding protein ZinT [Treponema sp.]|jgi:zinc transport system substrate-binding protein|nr:metal-binding protein ZinT [Treponema sp.]
MKRFYGLWAVVLAAGFLSAGCVSGPSLWNSGPLSDWTGTWNNFSSYFDNPGIVRAYEILAEREGKSPDDIKTRYVTGTTYKCDIAAMGIQGNTVTFYSKPQSVVGAVSNVEYKGQYVYKGEVSAPNNPDRLWKHFETLENIPYKHLIMLPAEADITGETMIHFHFRYGDDLDKLLAADGWFATVIAYDSTMDLLVNHMTAD